MKLKIKKGDEVEVIAGKNKGARGRVLMVQPTAMRILVEGVNIRKKAVRPSPKHPNGGIVEMEGPIHYSNVQHADKVDAKRSRSAKPAAKAAKPAKKASKKAKTAESGTEE